MTNFVRIDTDSSDHWSAHARQWSRIGSPLRPHADDIEIMRNFLHGHVSRENFGRGGLCRGLLLGATPELMQLNNNIIALDRERAMIEMLHASTPSKNCAVQGDWLKLPFAARTFDFGCGDGSFNLIRYPQQYHALFEQLRNVLRANAALVLRVFTTPSHEEICAAVIAAAYAKKIENFHAFKWRFAMALVMRNRNANIGVADIYREFEQWIPDRTTLAASTGWPIDIINTIDVYRNSPAVYSFPTAEEWSVIAARHGVEIERRYGGYELGERCPIIALRVNV